MASLPTDAWYLLSVAGMIMDDVQGVDASLGWANGKVLGVRRGDEQGGDGTSRFSPQSAAMTVDRFVSGQTRPRQRYNDTGTSWGAWHRVRTLWGTVGSLLGSLLAAK